MVRSFFVLELQVFCPPGVAYVKNSPLIRRSAPEGLAFPREHTKGTFARGARDSYPMPFSRFVQDGGWALGP